MTYKLVFTDSYLKKLKKFLKKNPEILDRYKKTIKLLELDPYHPSLRLHKLKGNLNEYFSISITMKHRIIIDFILEDDKIIPLDIGTHSVY